MSSSVSWSVIKFNVGASFTSVIAINIVPSSESLSLLVGFDTIYLISSTPEKFDTGLYETVHLAIWLVELGSNCGIPIFPFSGSWVIIISAEPSCGNPNTSNPINVISDSESSIIITLSLNALGDMRLSKRLLSITKVIISIEDSDKPSLTLYIA